MKLAEVHTTKTFSNHTTLEAKWTQGEPVVLTYPHGGVSFRVSKSDLYELVDAMRADDANQGDTK